MLAQQTVDQGAGLAQSPGPASQIAGLGQRAARAVLRLKGDGLPILQAALGVCIVKVDHVQKRARSRVGAGRKVGVEALLELIEQNTGLPVAAVPGQGSINRHSPGLFQRGKGPLGQHLMLVRQMLEVDAADADAHPAQSRRVEKGSKVPAVRLNGPGGRVVGIRTRQHGQQSRGVGHGARQGAGGVLRRTDGNDAGAADQPFGRLDPDDTVPVGGAENRPACLSPHRCGAQVGRHGDGAARARPADVKALAVGTAHRAPARAEAVAHTVGEKVGQLGQVGLTQNDRARVPQAGDNMRVKGRIVVCQRQRARAGVHFVMGVDVVLDEHRHAVQRSARSLLGVFAVQCLGNIDGIRVDFEHSVERRTLAVNIRNALKVPQRQLERRQLSGCKGLCNGLKSSFAKLKHIFSPLCVVCCGIVRVLVLKCVKDHQPHDVRLFYGVRKKCERKGLLPLSMLSKGA